MSAVARRGRTIAVLGTVVAALVGILTSGQTWIVVTLVDGRTLEVAGTQAAGALMPLSLASLALALALTLAGPIATVVLAALEIVLGVCIGIHSATSSGSSAATPAIVEATGITGPAQAAEIAGIATSPWHVAGIVAGALMVLLGILALATMRAWPRRGARRAAVRYEREGSGLDWDALDEGDDPTAARGDGDHGPPAGRLDSDHPTGGAS